MALIGDAMPIRYRCSNCGNVLFEFRGVGQSYMGVPTPEEVVKLVGHICPSCKRELEIPSRHYKDYILIRSAVPMFNIATRSLKPSLRLAET